MDTNKTTRTFTQVVSAIIEDDPAALQRVIDAFRAGKFQVVSWSVGSCEREGFSRLTMEVEGGSAALKTCCCQVANLIPVLEIEPLEDGAFVAVCHALLRIEACGSEQDAVLDLLGQAGAKLLSLQATSVVAQLSTTDLCLAKLLEDLGRLGAVECIRTGLTALRR